MSVKRKMQSYEYHHDLALHITLREETANAAVVLVVLSTLDVVFLEVVIRDRDLIFIALI